MSTGEIVPYDNPADHVSGVHSDIVFETPANLWAYLDTVKGHARLYDSGSDTQFEYPIESTDLYYHRNDSGDIELTATVRIDQTVAAVATDGSWQSILSDSLSSYFKNDLGEKVYHLPHQERDFYVGVDDNYAARVEFDTETNDCSVIISLEKLHNVFYGLNLVPGDEVPEHDAQSDHYQVMKTVSWIWSVVLDATINRFGDGEVNQAEKAQIVIAAPVDFRIPGTETIGKHAAVPGVTIPEIEMKTSMEDQFGLVGGLTHAKERLEDITATFLDPDGAAMYGITGRHFLLHGPAGTGKTSLVKAFANTIHAELIEVKSTDILDMYVGNDGKNIQKIFSKLNDKKGPVVLFFEEFDVIARKGSGSVREHTEVTRYLNTAIDNVTAEKPNIIIAAATNAEPDRLVSSLVRSRRLEPIATPLPNETERADIWAAVLAQSFIKFSSGVQLSFDDEGKEVSPAFLPYADDIDPVTLAKESEGMTGADFESILERARRQCYKKFRSTGELVRVSQSHILTELQHFGR